MDTNEGTRSVGKLDNLDEKEASSRNVAQSSPTTPPKTPKRRGSKTLRNLARRGSSMSILKLRSPTHSNLPENPVIEESVDEVDGILKKNKPEKLKKNKNSQKPVSGEEPPLTTPTKRPKFLRAFSSPNLKKDHQGQSIDFSPIDTVQEDAAENEIIFEPKLPSPDVQDFNYEEVLAETHKVEAEKEYAGTEKTQPFTSEYGKADIDSVEYGHDMIIQEIETGFFLGPVLRAVYEGNDHRKFLERLENRIKQHDRDIERMCNFHYQGFIESITELINVRTDADKLKAQTLIINKELQESGKEVARKSEDLIQSRLQQCNVASAIEKLTVCLPVLQMYAKMCEQMKARRYYSALKTLEQLEHTYLPRVYSYRFCDIMLTNIPKIREQIKEVSMSELKDFLENVRKNSHKIGMVAMKQVEKEHNLESPCSESTKQANPNQKQSTDDESAVEADRPTARIKPTQSETVKNHINTKKSKPTKLKQESKNTNQSASPKHRPRINPFDDLSDEESPVVMDNRNPFDEDTNPFGSETVEHNSNPFLDQESSDIPETDNSQQVNGYNPFAIEPLKQEPKSLLVDTTELLKGLNYESQEDTNPFLEPDTASSHDPIESVNTDQPKDSEPEGNPFLEDEEKQSVVIPRSENDSKPVKTAEPQSIADITNNPSLESNGLETSGSVSPGSEALPIKAPPRRKKKKAAPKVPVPPDEKTADTENNNDSPGAARSTVNVVSDVKTDNTSAKPLQNTEKKSDSSNKPPESVDGGPSSFLHLVTDLQTQRASLVEEMILPKWQKTRDWQMPRIYHDLSASDLVDFSPVYKCLHIFGLVGSRAVFESYYRTQRKNQARLVLQPPAVMTDNTETYAQYFYQIVGFFVVEDHVLHTAPNLISRQFIDDLWDLAISKLVAVLQADSGYRSDAALMMNVKNLIVIFADTLKAYGFSVTRLFTLLMELRDQYGEILLKRWAQKFNDVFNEDNYTPMLVESESQEQMVLSSFPYEDPNFENAIYPKKLPFSKFVPRIYNEIKQFILACLKYCEDLHLSSTEVDDMIRKSTNLLLTRTLASGLQTLVQKPSLGLTELVQIIVNTTHLENSCRHVEEFVHSITGVRVGSAHSAKLVGVSTFKDARNGTESQIYNKLNSKIDEFFELAEYDWNMKEPRGRASRYLLDLIAFLQHNFEVFTNLPSNVAQTACMSACRHISTSLMELIMDRDIKLITMAALQQFNLDVMQCELFSNSEPVPGFQDGALQMSFVELRQLLDLFLSWDWSSYLADYGSGNSKYLRVNPGTALNLLEKIKEERGHRNIFTSLSKQEREKKKLLETVVRQLRGIVNDGDVASPRKRKRFFSSSRK